jgi:hypothetical protein
VTFDHEQEHEHDYEIGNSPLDWGAEPCYKERPPMRRSPIALILSLFLVAATVDGERAKSEPAEIISHIKRDTVQSTALASVGYSRRLRALEIEFRNGAIYRYLNVDPAIYHELMTAPSKARFYDEKIRRKYRSLHVRRRPK